MHRLLVIGVALLAALALAGPHAAWSWPADGQVLRPFALGADPTPAVSIAGSTSPGADGSPIRAPGGRHRLVRRHRADARLAASRSRPTTGTPSRSSISARSASRRAPRSPKATPSGRWDRAGTPSTRRRASISGSAVERAGGLRRPARPSPAARGAAPRRPVPPPAPAVGAGSPAPVAGRRTRRRRRRPRRSDTAWRSAGAPRGAGAVASAGACACTGRACACASASDVARPRSAHGSERCGARSAAGVGVDSARVDRGSGRADRRRSRERGNRRHRRRVAWPVEGVAGGRRTGVASSVATPVASGRRHESVASGHRPSGGLGRLARRAPRTANAAPVDEPRRRPSPSRSALGAARLPTRRRRRRACDATPQSARRRRRIGRAAAPRPRTELVRARSRHGSATAASRSAPLVAAFAARLASSRWRASDGPPVESTAMERYYVTTPIYYVNSTPHIGHAYTTIAADILVRHQRQRGVRRSSSPGSTSTRRRWPASRPSRASTPQEYADRIVEAWRELPARLNVANDFFIRTSDEGHKRFVQEFLQKIRDNGRDDIYQDVYAGLYCVGCEAFKTEDELVDGKCPEHDIEPEWIEEQQLVLPAVRVPGAAARALRRAHRLRAARLPGERGPQLHRGRPPGLLDQPRRAAVGHPDPVGPGSGRLRLGGRARQLPERARRTRGPARIWCRRSGRSVRHLLAKDILRFHCVYWPAMLLAAGYEVPRQLFVHGYLLLDDRKISKSLGNVVDPLDLIDVYGADAVRFWCARVGLVRPGRRGLDRRASTSATSASSATTSATSSRASTAMIARYRDGALRAPPSADSRGRGVPRAARRRRRGAARRVRPDRGARADLGGRPRAQPTRRGDGAVAAREGRVARGRARPRALRPRRRHPGRCRRARRVPPRDGGADPRGARAAAALGWDEVAYGRARAVDGIEPAPPLFPRVDEPATAA